MDKAPEPTPPEEDTLWQIVKRSIRQLDHLPDVDPVVVADDAIKSLTPALMRLAAHLMLRQIARQILSVLHKPGTKRTRMARYRATEAEPTFPGDDFSLLKARYPKAHVAHKPQGYTPRDKMTEEDWEWNLTHGDNEISAKSAHYRQLERWGIKVKGFVRAADKVEVEVEPEA